MKNSSVRSALKPSLNTNREICVIKCENYVQEIYVMVYSTLHEADNAMHVYCRKWLVETAWKNMSSLLAKSSCNKMQNKSHIIARRNKQKFCQEGTVRFALFIQNTTIYSFHHIDDDTITLHCNDSSYCIRWNSI